MNQQLIWKIQSLWETHSSPQEKSPCSESAFFTRIKKPSEITLGDQTVFTDNYGSYKGLSDKYLLCQNVPIYIFDNHNNALLAFLELKNQTGAPLTVVHIDAHPDDAIYSKNVTDINSENIQEIYKHSRISDFLNCAEKGNLITSPIRITTEAEFQKPYHLPEQPYIVSLDIDIFGPEGAFTNLESKIATIAHYWNHAEAVTIATSPGFIDQETALQLLTIFLTPTTQH